MATIADSTGHASSVRARFVVLAGGTPTLPIRITPLRNFAHLAQGDCAAFGAIQCDGVTVKPGDIVVADADGVAVVPRESAEKVLVLAQQLDFKEHSMYPIIEKARSIMEGVKQLGRL